MTAPPTPDVVARGLSFPEGPLVARDGEIWCVEVTGGALVRCSENGPVERIHIGGRPNGLAQDPVDHTLWMCDAERDAIRRVDPLTRRIDDIATEINGQPLFHPNDLVFDPAGNLLFTCPGDSRTTPSGYLCCLAPDRSVTVVKNGMYFPNGLAFTPGGEYLVVAETYRQRLWRGRWDATSRRWLEPRVWVEGLHGPPGPDGMAFTSAGLLFVAVFGSGSVAVIDAAGVLVDRLATPGSRPTNVAIERDESTLLVTEAQHGELLRLDIAGWMA